MSASEPSAPSLVVAACADADLVTIQKTSSGERKLQSMGIVTELGTGLADAYPRECRLSLGRLSGGWETPQQVTWLRIQPIERGEILLAFAAPGLTSPIRQGDVIRVEARSGEPYTAGEGNGWFELRDESRQLLFWYGAAESVATLNAPQELQWSEGVVQAPAGSTCRPGQGPTRLDAEAAGVSVSLGWFEQAAVGDWLVTNLGAPGQRFPSACPSASGAAAAIWPRSLSAGP